MTEEKKQSKQSSREAREELHGEILKDITARTTWENRQVDFYKMRHNGIRRKEKPWKNAADLHWPLIDTNIEKLKPLFFQQIVGMDVVATFVPMRQQIAAATTTAEQWFDYKVRERTNLQDEALAWIDYALMSGRGVIKAYWDQNKGRVQYAAKDPLYIIVPSHTKDLQDADRIVDVMPMSVAAFKRAGVYKCDKATLERIKGVGDSKDAPNATQDSATQLREGITHDSKSEKIIVWEVYERTTNGRWVVYTFSPTAPEIDLREPMELPYDHGMVPFVDFPYEIKDKGWYSPRGIAEILAAFEAALCHAWNQKHDSMQLFNKPMFRAEREVPNSMNLRAEAGKILPYGIVPVQMPQPPVSFDDEIVQTRSVAEQRVANPDYGMGQVINTANRRTAREIDAIGAQTAQAGDLRARIFRLALGKLYKMTWALLLQYDKEDLKYRYLQDSLQVDPNALHEEYHLEPKGGVNEVNRQMLLQKAVARKQIFQNSPWIDQAELDKSILNLDDPSLIKSVFRDPNLKSQDETEDELRAIPAMLIGGPIPVKQGQNYPLRIGVLMQFLKNAADTGQQLPPAGVQRIVERIDAMLSAHAQQDTNGARELGRSVGEFLQASGFMSQGVTNSVPPEAVAQ